MAVDRPADPVVSPADTIRQAEEWVEEFRESWDWPPDPDLPGGVDRTAIWRKLDDAATLAEEMTALAAALLAVGERDRQQIARLTEAAKAADTAMRWHYEDVVPAAEVPDEATAFEVAIALVRAVLAGEEDAGDEA